jgi:hypothetical protein
MSSHSRMTHEHSGRLLCTPDLQYCNDNSDVADEKEALYSISVFFDDCPMRIIFKRNDL